jgi:cobalt/nickel transport system permease protein
MHIPDGFVDAKTAVAAAVISTIGLGIALHNVRRCFPARRIPLLGLAAAFIFAAQMLNFPVAGGTSGHIIGAVLAAVLLGPSAAIIVLSTVLILQCFMFADGGVTALGTNIFNMAIVATLTGYGVYRLVLRAAGGTLRGRLLGIAFGSWCSTVAASIACSSQLALSETVTWGIAFPAMTWVHMLIGIGEALITTLVVAAVIRVRPELLADKDLPLNIEPRYRELAAYGLLLTVGLSIFVAPFACGWPDGLEKVAGALGFAGKAAGKPLFAAPLPDYAVPDIKSAVASTAIAAGVGTLIAFLLAYLLARFLASRAKGADDTVKKGDSCCASRSA